MEKELLKNLDNMLLILKEKEEISLSLIYLEEQTEPLILSDTVESILQLSQLAKLSADEYAYKVVNEKNEYKFQINYNGIIALETNDNKPYQRNYDSQKRKKVWEVVKIIAIVLNAIALLILSYLQIIHQKS